MPNNIIPVPTPEECAREAAEELQIAEDLMGIDSKSWQGNDQAASVDYHLYRAHIWATLSNRPNSPGLVGNGGGLEAAELDEDDRP